MVSVYDGIPEAWKNDIRFLQTVSELSGLSVAVWRTGKSAEEICWTSDPNGEHPCFSHEPLRLALEEYCHADRPSIFFENDLAVYGIVPVGSFSLALGPAVIWSASEAYLQDYAQSHGVRNALPIPRGDLGAMGRYMELVYLHFNGASLPRETIPVTADILEKWQRAGDLEEYQLEQSENDRSYELGADYERHNR